MLNISPQGVKKYIEVDQFSALRHVEGFKSQKLMIRLLSAIFLLGFILLFLPWTQNIRGRGNVIALKPDQRPQTIHSVIAGRIEKWYVQDGDFVNRGDTIMFISEIKDQYFDPELLSRTQRQLSSKGMAVESYQEKANALDKQIVALQQTADLKLEQARNKLKQAKLKVTSDSIDFQAAKINFNIAKQQYDRMEALYEDGLKSKTDFENRDLKLQKANAEMISHEQKLLTSRNEVLNARVELNSIVAQYQDEIAKARSERFTALSNMYDAEVAVQKLENQYTNYSVRTGMYYITAPQAGYVTQAIQSGLGETIKEGSQIVSIMPSQYDLAVEMYVRPIDLPLLEKGQHVRIQFDGWPAIVFSGWPNTSYGTYGGTIFAIDNFISPNGKFRIVVVPDVDDHPWPEALRVGGGTNSMILLKNVPVWYEIWRQINGFPPDYYEIKEQNPSAEK